MRVSYDWLKTMIDIPEDPKTLSDEYIRTGTEVEAIDTVGESFDHVVTAKVLTKIPHPDSDHMYVCSVDVGDKNLDADGNPAPLQIVCGAQNFEAGDHIVTAMIGAVLPGDVKIKKSKLRGVVSMGMNCSARELGLGGDHSGIMILPEDTPCGMPFAEYVGSSDTVLDCEITPNRPDCLSMIGMARETGAIFDRDFHVELPAIKVETGRATDAFRRDRRRGPVRPLRCPHRAQRQGRPVARLDGQAPQRPRRAPAQQHRRHHQLRDDAHRSAAARL